MKIQEKRESAIRKNDLMRKNKLHLYMMCTIPILLIFVFCYIPMFGAVIAFKDYNYADGILKSPWAGLDNFKLIFAADSFKRAAVNTIVLNALFITVSFICALSLAIIMYETVGKKRIKMYQTVLILPNFMSWVVVGYMLYGFINPEYGILNSFLEKIGVQKIQWYSKPGIWPLILTAATVWKNIGMDMILYYAALMGIDSQLTEAAEIDGAGKLKTVWHIMIPSILHTIIITLILKIGGIFRADFGLFYQLTRNVSKLYPTTDVMDTYIFRALKTDGDISVSSAAGLLQSCVGFVLVLLTNLIIRRIDDDYALF
ncbi:MAG: ABC transporter permease subunit [Clostridia bacterium]|nr:ABC transporter permease subunit [Clostridia bacterium]